MKPNTIEEALQAGWVRLTPEQVEAQKALHPPGPAAILAAPVDCNSAPEGTPCGGFGHSVVCFCKNGLCECFGAPGGF